MIAAAIILLLFSSTGGADLDRLFNLKTPDELRTSVASMVADPVRRAVVFQQIDTLERVLFQSPRDLSASVDEAVATLERYDSDAEEILTEFAVLDAEIRAEEDELLAVRATLRAALSEEEWYALFEIDRPRR